MLTLLTRRTGPRQTPCGYCWTCPRVFLKAVSKNTELIYIHIYIYIIFFKNTNNPSTATGVCASVMLPWRRRRRRRWRFDLEPNSLWHQPTTWRGARPYDWLVNSELWTGSCPRAVCRVWLQTALKFSKNPTSRNLAPAYLYRLSRYLALPPRGGCVISTLQVRPN